MADHAADESDVGLVEPKGRRTGGRGHVDLTGRLTRRTGLDQYGTRAGTNRPTGGGHRHTEEKHKRLSTHGRSP